MDVVLVELGILFVDRMVMFATKSSGKDGRSLDSIGEDAPESLL